MSLRRSSALLLRRLGLSTAADLARYRFQLLRSRHRIAAARQNYRHTPLPPPYFIYETYRLDYDRYFRTGQSDAERIVREAGRFMSLDKATVLDWGCGPARVLRHMPRLLPDATLLAGSDYNARYIDWCAAAFPELLFRQNNLLPPLLFESRTFTLIYSISVFTHLSPEAQEEWVKELHRVLKPGGHLLLTTHGNVTLQNLTDAEQALFKQGEVVVRGGAQEGHRLFAAYNPPETMRRLFSPYFRITRHQPGKKEIWGYSQDLWIFEKI